MQLQTESNQGPILASTSCQFVKPLFYPGEITIFSRVSSVKNSSFSIQHKILNDWNEIAAEAIDIIVFYDFNANTKLKLSNEIRESIEMLENKE